MIVPTIPPSDVRVGFTGTRRALLTSEQAWVRRVLTELHRPGAQFHHGDCVGADWFAQGVASELDYYTVAHPGEDTRFRAYTANDYTMPARSALERDHQIVFHSTVLVAVPREREVLRSGTWATVRFARYIGGRSIRNWWIEKDSGSDRIVSGGV